MLYTLNPSHSIKLRATGHSGGLFHSSYYGLDYKPATSCESIAIFIIDLERPTETWMLVFANYWVPSYFICASRGDAERSSCMLAVKKTSAFI